MNHPASLINLVDRGSVGVWCPQLRTRDHETARSIASAFQTLRYSAIWIPGGTGGPLFEHVTTALEATDVLPIATGVVNMLMHTPEDTAQWFSQTRHRFGDRLVLGLGASHVARAQALGIAYRPIGATREYLRRLDNAVDPVPRQSRLLGALGPEMLSLAKEQTAGAHTYLVNASHTRMARKVLGDGVFLAPVVKVVDDVDRPDAIAVARHNVAAYLDILSYRHNILRMGFDEAELDHGGSDRLITELVACNGYATLADRIRSHVEAGADHVCVQVIAADRKRIPWQAWQEIASLQTSFASSHGHSSE